MKVFIVRHGEASFDAPSDHERALTPHGEMATRRLIEAQSGAFGDVEVIWCSHLKRAVQTAACYAEELGLKPERQSFLSPSGSPMQVIKKLATIEARYESILLVSHQPLVGELVSLLCNGSADRAHPYVTSEVVVLELDYPTPGIASQVANFKP